VDRLGLPEAFVAIHCTGSDATRDWHDAGWRELIEYLADRRGIAVVEVGLAPHAIRAPAPRQRSLCGALSLPETAEAIRRARLFVGIDSGPAHLASAVGTRGVVLLGRFRGLARYMPFSGAYATGERCELVWAEDALAALPAAPVLAAVERALA